MCLLEIAEEENYPTRHTIPTKYFGTPELGTISSYSTRYGVPVMGPTEFQLDSISIDSRHVLSLEFSHQRVKFPTYVDRGPRYLTY